MSHISVQLLVIYIFISRNIEGPTILNAKVSSRLKADVDNKYMDYVGVVEGKEKGKKSIL